MRTQLSILSIFILLLSSQVLNAQTRVEKRAKQRANQNVDRKVDEAVDDVFNGLFKKKKKKKTAETPAGVEGTETDVPTSADDGPWEPIRNETPLSFVMDMTLTKKNGKTEEYTIQMVFDEWKLGMISETKDGKARFILNNQDGTMTTITESKGSAPQGFEMKQRSVSQAMVDQAHMEYTVTKTGNTRVIDGYNTTEYLIEHEEGTTNAWITEDIEADYSNLMKIWQTQQKKQAGKTPFFGDTMGFPIESTTVDKKGRTSKVHYRDIKVGADIDRSPLDVTGVKIMKLGL